MLAVILAALLALATAPPFPYHRYSEIPSVEPIGPTCPEGDVMELHSGEAYRILSTKERDIFIHFEQGEVDYVYFAQGNGAEGIIHIVHAYTVDEAKAHYPAGPCSYFHEVGA